MRELKKNNCLQISRYHSPSDGQVTPMQQCETLPSLRMIHDAASCIKVALSLALSTYVRRRRHCRAQSAASRSLVVINWPFIQTLLLLLLADDDYDW